MRVILIAVAVVLTFEAFALTIFPASVKRMFESLSPREIQVVGVIEMALALALVCFLVCGA